MTCIVGLVDGEKVWLGADSFYAAGCERLPMTPDEPKVFAVDRLLFGCAGPSRMGQLLRHQVFIPEYPDDADPFVWLVKELMPQIKQSIDAYGGLKINDRSDGWDVLVGLAGRLFYLCSDLSVSTLSDYGAIGCGRSVALGSLYSTKLGRAEDRVMLALEAATAHDTHVAKPFQIESVA